MDKEIRKILIIVCVLMSILSCKKDTVKDKVELLNKGNEFYEEKDFEKAEEYYKKSLEANSQYYKANLNTGHSLYQQAFSLMQKEIIDSAKAKCSNAELYYNNSVTLAKNKNEKAESLYHLGNSQLLGQKLEESIESYEKSLRLVPENMDAKYNLSLAQYLLKKEEQEEEKEEEKEEKEEKEEEEKEEVKEEEKTKKINKRRDQDEEETRKRLHMNRKEERSLEKDW